MSYANVTATLALVLSLGGASYAALELPRNSVGRAQLKPRSVDQRALAVPIAATATVEDRSRVMTGHPKPECPPQPDGAPPCAVVAPPPKEETLETLRFRTRASGLLLVSAVAGAFVDAGEDDGSLMLSASLDDARLPGTIIAEIPMGGTGQATYLSSSSVPRGRHVLTLRAAVTSFDTRLGVGPVSLHATVLPQPGG